MNMPQTLKCDICGNDIYSPIGYCLTTTQVVSSPGQWKLYYKKHQKEMAFQGIESYENFCKMQRTFRTIFIVASISTPWLVCEICINLFDVDMKVARDYVKKWLESNGTFILPSGPAPFSAINLGDGQFWD